MSSGIEFEQKFVLDTRMAFEIINLIRYHQPEALVYGIRQYYNKNGERCREIKNNTLSFIRETKQSIKLGTPYSISLEEETKISKDEFEVGWSKSNKRLQKTRYNVLGRYPDHHVAVDFFYSSTNFPVYAIIAEDETMLTSVTDGLYLRFTLPIYLEPYILKVVDDSDPAMKIFKSTNMVDTPENIKAVKRAISSLYEQSP